MTSLARLARRQRGRAAGRARAGLDIMMVTMFKMFTARAVRVVTSWWGTRLNIHAC